MYHKASKEVFHCCEWRQIKGYFMTLNNEMFYPSTDTRRHCTECDHWHYNLLTLGLYAQGTNFFSSSKPVEESKGQTEAALTHCYTHSPLPASPSPFGRTKVCMNNVLPRSCGQDCYV